jgi:hypothetical protein
MTFLLGDGGGVEEDREHEQGGGHPGRERDQPCNQWGPEPTVEPASQSIGFRIYNRRGPEHTVEPASQSIGFRIYNRRGPEHTVEPASQSGGSLAKSCKPRIAS